MTELLDRISKLIALSTSDNRNEAATAALTACRLIREHGLLASQALAVAPAVVWKSSLPHCPKCSGSLKFHAPYPNAGLLRCADCRRCFCFYYNDNHDVVLAVDAGERCPKCGAGSAFINRLLRGHFCTACSTQFTVENP